MKSLTLGTLGLLCLLSGCSKQPYFFPAQTGTSVSYQKVQPQALSADSFSPAGEDAGPALAALEGLPIEKYQPSAETRALVKHLSGEIKDDPKVAAAPHHPVAAPVNKSGQDKKLPYKQKQTSKLGKISLLLSLAGLAFLLLTMGWTFFVFPGFFAAFLGVLFSIPALTDIKRGPKDLKDRRKAKIGLILGLIAVVASLIISLHKYEW